MWLEFIATICVLLLVILVGIFVWRYLKSTKQDVNDKIKQVVDRYNSSSEYTYKFDKQQEKNIQNVETNMHQMFNNYAYVKNEVLKLDETTVKKHALAKEVETDTVNIKKELQLGEFKMVERAPKEVLARADGKNWLFLYHSSSPDAGLTTNKIDADKVSANNAYVDSDLAVKGNTSVGKDWLMGEKWIMNIGGPEGSALQFAPKSTTNDKNWDRTKQVRFTNDGYVDATNGGVVTRGAKSAHNPDGLNTLFPHAKDNKNYVRGDTQVDGEFKVVGRGSFNKELCIGNVCLKEANGVVQACKSDLTRCAPIQLANTA